MALVDEFQDIDPSFHWWWAIRWSSSIQWEIMRRVFGDGEATIVLIGDPKQAIYSFRGARRLRGAGPPSLASSAGQRRDAETTGRIAEKLKAYLKPAVLAMGEVYYLPWSWSE